MNRKLTLEDKIEIIKLLKFDKLIVTLSEDGFLNYFSYDLECIYSILLN